MEKRCLVISAIIFILILAGCIEMKRPLNQTPNPVINATLTPSENPTYEPTPALTPPPGRATPIPPGLIVMEFMKHYNKREAGKIYALLSERVRANHSINDVAKELEYAERHNITITPTEDLLDKLWHIEAFKTMYRVNLSIKSKEGVRNTTIDFPLVYIPYTEKRDNYTIVGETGYIDGWVFDEILRDLES